MSELTLDCELTRGNFCLRLKGKLPLESITALFGPNGCGKTSTLQVIAGLASDIQGQVRFDREIWHDSASRSSIATHHRRAAVVFQNPRLFSHLNVEGNLNYATHRARSRGTAIDQHQVIAAFDLAELLNRNCTTLSGGESQRVQIARALLSGPKLLLMDEPLSALDIVRRAEALNYIERIPELFGVPVLYVTHSIDEVARLAGHMVLMKSGEIVASGGVPETLARLDLPPLTGRFEAGVVLDGQITGQDTQYDLTEVDIGGNSLHLPRLDYPTGHHVRLRIRARDVAIATKKPTDISIRNVLKVTVREIAPEADTAYAELRLSGGNQDLRARITRAAVAELKLKSGKQVFALIKSVALDRRLLSPAVPAARTEDQDS